MGLKLITPIAAEPITPTQVKSHLRLDLDDTSEDDQINKWIKTARQYGENYTRRAFGTQTWELSLDNFPCKNYIEIPRPPMQSVESVKYYDSVGTEHTMSTSDYIVDVRNEPGKVVLGYCKIWPIFVPQTVNAVIIKFVCGYTDDNLIPDEIVSGMLFHCGLLYKYRDEGIPAEHMDSLNRCYYPNRIFTF